MDLAQRFRQKAGTNGNFTTENRRNQNAEESAPGVLRVLLRGLRGEIWFFIILLHSAFSE
jgi:hypothetical protein